MRKIFSQTLQSSNGSGKKYAVVGKVIELAESVESMSEAEKQTAVDRLRIIGASTDNSELNAPLRDVLPGFVDRAENADDVASSKYWDNVREYGYAAAGIGAALVLPPLGAAKWALGLLVAAEIDDVLIDKPSYKSANDILRSTLQTALATSHSLLTDQEEAKHLLSQADLPDTYQFEDLEGQRTGQEASILNEIYHKLQELDEASVSAEDLAQLTSRIIRETSVGNEKFLKLELDRREQGISITQELRRKERTSRLREKREVDASFQLTSMATSLLLKDPQAALVIDTAYKSYSVIESAVLQFTAVPPALGPVGLTSSIASAVLNLTGVFKKKGPTPEQQILEALQAVQESIGELKKMVVDLAGHLDKRIDEISKNQARILRTLERGIDDILESQSIGFSQTLDAISRLSQSLEISLNALQEDRIRQENEKFHERLQVIQTVQRKLRQGGALANWTENRLKVLSNIFASERSRPMTG